MARFTIPKGSKVISSIKRKSFRASAVGLTASQLENLADIIWVPRLGTITPLEFDMSYGRFDVPSAGTVVQIEWMLTLVDVDNLPQAIGARDRAIWFAAQLWVCATAVGFVDMMKREIQDFFNPASFSFTEVADYTQRLVVSLLTFTGSADVDVSAMGVMTFQEDLIQRKWGGDNSTFDVDDGDWEDFASDEEGDDGGD